MRDETILVSDVLARWPALVSRALRGASCRARSEAGTDRMTRKVLIADDDGAAREGLAALLSGWGYAVEQAATAPRRSTRRAPTQPSVVITDLIMPGMDGLELLRALQEELPFAAVILLTGQGHRRAVAAMKEGAYDFLTKPVDVSRLKLLIPKAAEKAEALREVALLRRRVKQVWGLGRLVGTSRSCRRSIASIELAAPTPAPVLITRRERHGQGAGGAHAPRALAARPRALRGRQLRGHPRDAARERDLRPREGRVHGRARAAAGLLRAGPRGHDLPRRDRAR